MELQYVIGLCIGSFFAGFMTLAIFVAASRETAYEKRLRQAR